MSLAQQELKALFSCVPAGATQKLRFKAVHAVNPSYVGFIVHIENPENPKPRAKFTYQSLAVSASVLSLAPLCTFNTTEEQDGESLNSTHGEGGQNRTERGLNTMAAELRSAEGGGCDDA